jgi:hypothetical protein
MSLDQCGERCVGFQALPLLLRPPVLEVPSGPGFAAVFPQLREGSLNIANINGAVALDIAQADAVPKDLATQGNGV